MDFFSSIFGGEDTRELTYLKVTGKYSFHVEPVMKGILPYHSNTVMVTCYKDARKLCPIDFRCDWFRLIEDRLYPIEDNNTDTYHFNPYDIGVSIKVVVTSMSVEFPGAAHIEMGPIKMDYAIRPHIKDTVLAGKAEFRVKLIQLDDTMVTDLTEHENKVLINRSEMVVVLAAHKDIEPCMLHIPYEKSILFRIECDNHDPKAVHVYFEHEEKERLVKLQFISRVARDLFIMSMRIIKVLRTSCITDMVNSYGKILSKEWLPKKLNPDDGDEYFDRFQEDTANIKHALKMTVSANKDLSKENDELMEYIDSMESDLNFCIREFTGLLQEMKERKGTVDIQKYEEANKSIAAQSNSMMSSMKANPNSSFNIKRSSKGQNVHNRKIFEIEQMNSLQVELENAKKLNGILETELIKLRTNKGLPVPKTGTDRTLSSSMLRSDPKLAATMNLQRSIRKAPGAEDDDDSSMGMSLENVLADLEDIDYKTYNITKEEIEKYKETMQLRMSFTEEKRTHDILVANLEQFKELKKNALENKDTFDIKSQVLPAAAEAVGLTLEKKLVQILKDMIKEHHRLLQDNLDASKANLTNEQTSDELIQLKIKYLLKKNSTLDEQSEKAEEELTSAIVEYFKSGGQFLNLSNPGSPGTKPRSLLSSPKAPTSRVQELKDKHKSLQADIERKAKLLDEEKAKNAAVKSQLEKAIAEKKAYAVKTEQLAKLQAEIASLTKRLDQINKERDANDLNVGI